jgi:alpha-L-fucosidase 2
VTYAYTIAGIDGLPAPNVTCLDDRTLSIRNYVSIPGMLYEILVQAQAPGGLVSCSAVSGASPPNATLTVLGASEVWISWVGGTNYDMAAGNAAANYSFQGPDPHNNLVALLSSANRTSYAEILNGHIKDYTSLVTPFSLSLGQTPDLNTPTDQILAKYRTSVGDAYLEWVLFNYGRYLLASSARGTLPANLQGLWADGYSNPWGAGN